MDAPGEIGVAIVELGQALTAALSLQLSDGSCW